MATLTRALWVVLLIMYGLIAVLMVFYLVAQALGCECPM